MKTESGVPICLSLHIATYKGRERPENKPASKLDGMAGPLVWRGKMDCGYWPGNSLIKAPEDVLNVEIPYEPPYEGEIDLQLHIGSQNDIPVGELAPIAHSISQAALAYMNLALGEIMVPIAPMQISVLEKNSSHFQTTFTVAVEERRSVDGPNVQKSADLFVQTRVRQSAQEAQAMSVAARRYLSAMAEKDLVDRYCDLWESCEFATQFEKAKGGVVGHIAQAMALHLSSDSRPLNKSTVENALRLRELYKTRCRVVHEAVESPGDLEKNMRLLEIITTEVLRYKFGLPYSGVELLESEIRTSVKMK